MVSPSFTSANAPEMSVSVAFAEMATQRPVPVQRGLLDDMVDGVVEAGVVGAEDELLLHATASRAIAPGNARTKMAIGSSVPKRMGVGARRNAIGPVEVGVAVAKQGTRRQGASSRSVARSKEVRDLGR